MRSQFATSISQSPDDQSVSSSQIVMMENLPKNRTGKYLPYAFTDLKERIEGHDAQLNQIYDALENMLDKKVEEENRQKEWSERERIGFKK